MHHRTSGVRVETLEHLLSTRFHEKFRRTSGPPCELKCHIQQASTTTLQLEHSCIGFGADQLQEYTVT